MEEAYDPIVYTIHNPERDPSPSTPSPARTPIPGTVTHENKNMIEKHIDKYLTTQEKLDNATQITIATPTAAPSLTQRGFVYWLTSLGRWCGSVNDIWNVLLLLRRLRILRLLKFLSDRIGRATTST